MRRGHPAASPRPSSVAVFEDLGVQMNRHSTLVSYLEKLVWLLTGNLANPGGQYIASTIGAARAGVRRPSSTPSARPRTPGRRRADHRRADPVQRDPRGDPHRPPRPLPGDDRRVGQPGPLGRRQPADARGDAGARRASSCIDVFMTETARLADYVLPATTQFEKFEATFFNFEFPQNVFHLRRPVVDAAGRAAARAGDPRPARRGRSARRPPPTSSRCAPPPSTGRGEFAAAFAAAIAAKPTLGRGRRRSCCTARSARRCRTAPRPPPRCGRSRSRCAQMNPDGVRPGRLRRRARTPGDRLFDAILDSPSGVVFTDDDLGRDVAAHHDRRRPGPPRRSPSCSPSSPRSATRRRPATTRVAVPAVGRRAALVHRQHDLPRPGVAQAGRRRTRCASPRPMPTGSGSSDGDRAALTTEAGRVDDRPSPSTTGCTPATSRCPTASASITSTAACASSTGVAPNELTGSFHRDRWAGTPWHKTVPARLERVT